MLQWLTFVGIGAMFAGVIVLVIACAVCWRRNDVGKKIRAHVPGVWLTGTACFGIVGFVGVSALRAAGYASERLSYGAVLLFLIACVSSTLIAGRRRAWT